MGGTAAEVLEEVVGFLPGGGESRPGQMEMATAVERAFDRHRHLVVQAGTGTGKSLAYLVPAILSGRTVVVATATKALQDQLDHKDLPFLAEHLDAPFAWTVVKGRANYACRQRLDELGSDDDASLFDPAPASIGSQVARLAEWAQGSLSGDRAELDFEPDRRAWSSVSVSSRECPGAARCARGEDCFAETARRAAAASSVVVVNLHLYVMDLLSAGMILPQHDLVVVDEVHQLEDVVSAAAGIELTAARFVALARLTRPLTGAAVSDGVADLAAVVERELGEHLGRRLRRPRREIEHLLVLARSRLERLREGLDGSGGDDASTVAGGRLARARSSLGSLLADIDVLAETGDGSVVWVEGTGRESVLRSAPLEVGQLLGDLLWSDRTAVLTSATIPDVLPARLGLALHTADRIDVDSPFDYGSNGLLYCALDLPDPRSDDFDEAAAADLAALVDAAGGRTLGLFTSWRAVDVMAPVLRDALPYRVLTQRDLPKQALIEEFVADEATVLLATMSFWQGVDLPGSTLSLVAIDRIPFPRPDEPLLQARRERARGDAFRAIDLPRATVLLAQGAGRLIRTAADRGVVAVLDRRLGTAGYRWDLVRALPPMRRTRDRAEVEAFLRRLRQPAA